MLCSKCGATLEDGTIFCPECGARQESKPVEAAPAKPHSKPPIALRVVLQFISFVLCVCLFTGVLTAAMLADVHVLTGAGGISRIINAVISISTTTPAAPRPSWGVVPRSTYAAPETRSGSDGENSISDSLVDTLLGILGENMGEELPITEEQIKAVIAESTLPDYLGEKISSYVEDFINGTANTAITTEEVMELLEENRELLASEFGLEITPEMKQEIAAAVDDLVENQDINAQIHQQINSAMEEMLTAGDAGQTATGGVDVQQIRAMLQFVSSDWLLFGSIAACVVLIALLCLANFYNVPAGLTWSAVPTILMGLVLTLPLAAVELLPQTVSMPSEAAMAAQLAAAFADTIAPVHLGVLGIGVALLVVSIVWRCVRASLRKKQAAL